MNENINEVTSMMIIVNMKLQERGKVIQDYTICLDTEW